jgi:hypothetical protein
MVLGSGDQAGFRQSKKQDGLPQAAVRRQQAKATEKRKGRGVPWRKLGASEEKICGIGHRAV